MTKNKKLLIAIGIVVFLGIVALVGNVCVRHDIKHKDNVLRIGFVVSLTGSSAGTGRPTANAVELLKKKFNDVEFFIEDSKSSPIAGIQAARKLVDIHSVDIIYCDLTNVAIALLDYTEKMKVVLIAPIILTDFTDRGKFTVRNFMTLDQQVSVVVHKFLEIDNAIKSERQQLVAIASNDEFGRNSIDGLNQCLESINDIVCAKVFYVDNNKESIRNVTLSAKNLNPDVVFVSSFSASLGNIIKCLREDGFNGIVLTTTAFTVPYIRAAAGDAIYNVIYPDFDKTPLYYSLRDEYLSCFNETPPLTTFLCHDGLSFLIKVWHDRDDDNLEDMFKKAEFSELDGAYGMLHFKNRELIYKLNAFMTECGRSKNAN